MSVRRLCFLVLTLAAACATPAPSEPPPPADPVLVVDSHTGCEGGGPHLEYRWERDGDWFVRGDQRVPAGLVTRLRELAVVAPDAATAPLPPEVTFTEEEIDRQSDDAWEAAILWMPWLEYADPPELTPERVRKVVREQLVGEYMSTDWSELSLTLPGDPPIRISTEKRRPFAQPWKVTVGDGEPRKVLSLDLSRHVMLLVDPNGPNYVCLEGARYWAAEFWRDEHLWSQEIGDPANRKYALALCEEIDGWAEVAERWRLARADIGEINLQPLSLLSTLRVRDDSLIDSVRWWNPMEDGDPLHDWTTFLDVVRRATAAAERLPFVAKWKAAGPNRAISLDVAGEVGHDETSPDMYFDPPWRDSGLAGSPEFELSLSVDGKTVANLLIGAEADGAVVVDGDESLAGTAEIYFHPKNGKYAILHLDGRAEMRTIGD